MGWDIEILASCNVCQVSIHICFRYVITPTGEVGEMTVSVLCSNEIGNGHDFLFPVTNTGLQSRYI